jgi:uncharacterized sulfatase
MPRSKRWPFNSGLQVPMLVRIPEKFRHLASADFRPGGDSHRLVSFVDLAPTTLSLAGVEPRSHMQGHAFLGAHQAPEQPYVFGFRGRMDERYDLVRSVRNQRYIYIRNYMPHKIYGQHLAYMFETPTTTVWKRLYDEGKLNDAQSRFWQTKPAEELYDLQQDVDEITNLAGSPQHKAELKKLRAAQQKLAADIRDVGFLPENEIHSRSQDSTPYEMGHDEKRFPFRRVVMSAQLASSPQIGASGQLTRFLQDPDSAVRYWGVMGFLIRGEKRVKFAARQLRIALEDPAPSVRIAAAEALGRYGSHEDARKSVAVLLTLAPADTNGIYVSLLATNALDAIGERARSARETLRTMTTKDPKADQRLSSYVPRLVADILSEGC